MFSYDDADAHNCSERRDQHPPFPELVSQEALDGETDLYARLKKAISRVSGAGKRRAEVHRG